MLGCDCAGLCTPIYALRAIGFEVKLAFACDSSHRAKSHCLDVHRPDMWLNDVLDRAVDSMPRVDVYTAGFPCQPFSSLGLRGGVLDPRGNVFEGCLEYIAYHLPTVFILEKC
jgi:site-specific DNA-cytosine methylase